MCCVNPHDKKVDDILRERMAAKYEQEEDTSKPKTRAERRLAEKEKKRRQ